MRKAILGALIGTVLATSGCAPAVPKDILAWTPETMAYRELSRRVYSTSDEANALQAASAVLQDLGYQITEGESDLGLLTGAKGAEGAGFGEHFAVALFGGDSGALVRERLVRVSIVTHIDASQRLHVRATFQVIGVNGYGVMTEAAKLDDPALYRGFFSKLDKALFLEGQHE